ncbi:MAG: hypothetical protein M4579_005740 [Chaenotheca gracillima]|nr:MAG: hypothetical protein M4579_005740 [Chaenotheca gracillima]
MKVGDFLGEYSGEIISGQEAERRGGLYDRRGLSYLFDVNKTQVIDATRAGNKVRFVNNTRYNENCKPKVLLSNGTHRIAMFACKDIKSGQELFFNYGYTGSALRYVFKEMENPEDGSELSRRDRRQRGTAVSKPAQGKGRPGRMQVDLSNEGSDSVEDSDSAPAKSRKRRGRRLRRLQTTPVLEAKKAAGEENEKEFGDWEHSP